MLRANLDAARRNRCRFSVRIRANTRAGCAKLRCKSDAFATVGSPVRKGLANAHVSSNNGDNFFVVIRMFDAVLLTILAFVSVNAMAETVRCPVLASGSPLTGASVYDGPPEEMADLVPESTSRTAGKRAGERSIWNVGYVFDAGRKLYLVCRYGARGERSEVKIKTKVLRCTYSIPRAPGRADLSCR